MEWLQAKSVSSNTYEIPERWLHIHYYEALNILFRMENALRVFVYVVLKNERREKWNETQLEISDAEQSSIKATAAKRISQAQGFGYVGYEVSSPLMFLNSGELTRLIFSEAHWNVFRPHFKGKKEIFQNKMEEISSVRNALAHFRPIKYDDVELVKQNIRHAFIGIEQLLTEMMGTHSPVPTNTAEEWYRKLSTLGTKSCRITLRQSPKEQWIRSVIAHTSKAIVRRNYSDDYVSYSVLRLNVPSILRRFASLAANCTYCFESVQGISMPEDKNPVFGKQVSLVFSKNSLTANADSIFEQLRDILTQIESEADQLAEDSLAKGQLLETVSATAVFRGEPGKKGWAFHTSQLESVMSENDPPEYWSFMSPYQSDFIASTPHYPWMPSDVSKEEIPF